MMSRPAWVHNHRGFREIPCSAPVPISEVVCWPSLAPALTPVKAVKLQQSVWQRNSCSSHLQLPFTRSVQWNLSPLLASDKETKFYCDGGKPLSLFRLLRKRKHFCSYLLTVTRLDGYSLFIYFLSIAANGMNVCYFMHVLTFTFLSHPPPILFSNLYRWRWNEILDLSSNETFSVMLKIPEECVSEEELPDMVKKRKYLMHC